MTPFNPENKEVLTYGDCLNPAMKITEQDDADQYFVSYVAYIQQWLERESRADDMMAEDIAKINLGYFAGYYDSETRERVERLFRCKHPIFGAIATEGQPSAKEAYEMGKNLR